jgi:hypothetical protein
MLIFVYHHRKNKDILRRFEKCGRDAALNRKATIDSINADKKVILGDSRLLSSRALELMKRKGRSGFRETSLCSSAKETVAEESMDN